MTLNPFIYDTHGKPAEFVPPRSMYYWHRPIRHQGIALSWLQALDRCVAEGRDYTEIHFYTHPETDEIVITYWDINT
jgi:hypothetical protein